VMTILVMCKPYHQVCKSPHVLDYRVPCANLHIARSNTHAHTHNHFTALWTLSGIARVSRYQKNHSPVIPYLHPPSVTIHGIIPVQFTCLTIFFHNLCPSFLWSTSWPGTVSFILHTFLHTSIYRKTSNKRPRRLFEHLTNTPRRLIETRRLLGTQHLFVSCTKWQMLVPVSQEN